MNLLKYFLTSLVFLGTYLPIFACSEGSYEPTPFDSVNSFKNSTSVISVQVIKVSPLDKESSKKKREVALANIYSPKVLGSMRDFMTENIKPIPIYKTVDMKVIKSYKGFFDKNKMLSFTSEEDFDFRRCGFSRPYSFYNQYLFTSEVNDFAILYIGQSGNVFKWEYFNSNYKEEMKDKMQKIKVGTYRDFPPQEKPDEIISKKFNSLISAFEDTTTFPVYKASH